MRRLSGTVRNDVSDGDTKRQRCGKVCTWLRWSDEGNGDKKQRGLPGIVKGSDVSD